MRSFSVINKSDLGRVLCEMQYPDVFELAAHVTEYDWSPSLFGHTGIRSNDNWKSTDLFVLDIDSGLSLDAAQKMFEEYQHVIAVTRHHQKEKHGIRCDRFRVVLFLERTITDVEEFAATWDRLASQWLFMDKACRDPARFYYACVGLPISVSDVGLTVPVASRPATPVAPIAVALAPAPRGELGKATLDFLVNGASPGQWNARLFKAAKDMNQQQYTLEESLSKFKAMANPHFSGKLDRRDVKTIESAFVKPAKYDPRKPVSDIVDFIFAQDLKSEAKDYLSDKKSLQGEPTGFEGLDRMLGGGTRAGELTVLQAHGKTGKNTLLHNILYRAIARGLAYGYASREMNPGSEVLPDLLSMALKKNVYKEPFKDEYFDVAQEWPLFFAPGFGPLSQSATERFFEACTDMGVKHFIYDHFHKGLQYEDYSANEQHIRFLKSLTKRFECHMFLVVQPKTLEEGQELSQGSLRGGAIIGQEINNLLLMKRIGGQDNMSKLTLSIARHKLAKPGRIYLKYDPETIIMTEVEEGSVSEESETSKPAEPRWKSLRAGEKK